MGRIHAALTQAKRDEQGVAAIEYGLTAALIAVVLLLALGSVGGSLGATFGGVASAFGTGPLSTGPLSTGPLSTGPSSSGGSAAAAAASFCDKSSQPFLTASPSTPCQSNLSNPAATTGSLAVSG